MSPRSHTHKDKGEGKRKMVATRTREEGSRKEDREMDRGTFGDKRDIHQITEILSSRSPVLSLFLCRTLFHPSILCPADLIHKSFLCPLWHPSSARRGLFSHLCLELWPKFDLCCEARFKRRYRVARLQKYEKKERRNGI